MQGSINDYNQSLIQLDNSHTDRIANYMKAVENDFLPPLSYRINISEMSNKLEN